MPETTHQALLNPTPPVGDEARVTTILNKLQETLGFVPDGIRLYSISPPLLETFLGNVEYFMQHPRLRGELTAMIRYLVSSNANCHFCIDLNESFLLDMGLDQDAVRAARQDTDQAPLPDNEKSLLKLALKSVDNPDSEDIEAVRDQGWNDRDIFDAVAQATSNRAFNYLLNTFKIERQGVFF